MAFASVSDPNVINCLPSVSLYVRNTIGNSVKNFSHVIYVSIQNQNNETAFSMHENVLKEKGKCSPENRYY